MGWEDTLDARIQKMQEYKALASRIKEIIDDDKFIEVLDWASDFLDTIGDLYLQREKADVEISQSLSRAKTLRKQALDGMVEVYGNEQRAKEELKKEYDPLKESHQNKRRAIFYNIMSKLSRPFSKDLSHRWAVNSKTYRSAAAACRRTYVLQQKTKQLNRDTIQNMHELEMAEARLYDRISQCGCSEEYATKCLEQPELISFGVIESVRQNQVPWL